MIQEKRFAAGFAKKTVSLSSFSLLLFLLLVVFCDLDCVLSLSLNKAAASKMETATMSVGASRMKQIVQTAAELDASSTYSLNGIYWLEHINLVVGSNSLAQYFYLDLLGLTRDTGKSFHVNLGQQQFHLAETKGDKDSMPIQRVAGSIGLTVPNLETLRQRFQSADAQHIFEIIEDTPQHLTVLGPWKNTFHVYGIQQNDNQVESTVDTPQKMTNLHAPGGAYGCHRMAVRGQPGIRYIEIPCPVGKVAAVAKFYRDLLKCTVHEITVPKDDSCDARNCAIITVGPGVHLSFVEAKSDDNGIERLQTAYKAMEGVHICIYVNDFEDLYHQLKARNLIWTNPRFVHLDTCDTWEEAKASFTFRFKDIIDLDTNVKILELEHETRPLKHGQYLKVPKYEPK